MAFVSSCGVSLQTARNASFIPTNRSRGRGFHVAVQRKTVQTRMATEPKTQDRTDTNPSEDFPFKPPTLNTTAFSDFLDSAQVKVGEFKDKAANIDTEQLSTETQATFRTLIDNALAGDWLNRGILDSLVGLLMGPGAILIGGVICGKGVFDLGRKQISIYPSPPPSAELRTNGLYSQIRHPVYAGVLLSSLGWSTATGSLERFAITVAFGYFLSKKIAVEEKYLRERFPEYEEYEKEVPDRMIPRIW